MEVRKPKIKSMKYEDFTDNEYLEKMIEELRANGTNVVMGCLDEVINWGRSNSLWPLTFATSCCGIEFMAVGAARYDFARFGIGCDQKRDLGIFLQNTVLFIHFFRGSRIVTHRTDVIFF